MTVPGHRRLRTGADCPRGKLEIRLLSRRRRGRIEGKRWNAQVEEQRERERRGETRTRIDVYKERPALLSRSYRSDIPRLWSLSGTIRPRASFSPRLSMAMMISSAMLRGIELSVLGIAPGRRTALPELRSNAGVGITVSSCTPRALPRLHQNTGSLFWIQPRRGGCDSSFLVGATID